MSHVLVDRGCERSSRPPNDLAHFVSQIITAIMSRHTEFSVFVNASEQNSSLLHAYLSRLSTTQRSHPCHALFAVSSLTAPRDSRAALGAARTTYSTVLRLARRVGDHYRHYRRALGWRRGATARERTSASDQTSYLLIQSRIKRGVLTCV
eukprot:6195768-Pleurochrysis_carterae.AAC.1